MDLGYCIREINEKLTRHDTFSRSDVAPLVSSLCAEAFNDAISNESITLNESRALKTVPYLVDSAEKSTVSMLWLLDQMGTPVEEAMRHMNDTLKLQNTRGQVSGINDQFPVFVSFPAHQYADAMNLLFVKQFTCPLVCIEVICDESITDDGILIFIDPSTSCPCSSVLVHGPRLRDNASFFATVWQVGLSWASRVSLGPMLVSRTLHTLLHAHVWHASPWPIHAPLSSMVFLLSEKADASILRSFVSAAQEVLTVCDVQDESASLHTNTDMKRLHFVTLMHCASHWIYALSISAVMSLVVSDGAVQGNQQYEMSLLVSAFQVLRCITHDAGRVVASASRVVDDQDDYEWHKETFTKLWSVTQDYGSTAVSAAVVGMKTHIHESDQSSADDGWARCWDPLWTEVVRKDATCLYMCLFVARILLSDPKAQEQSLGNLFKLLLSTILGGESCSNANSVVVILMVAHMERLCDALQNVHLANMVRSLKTDADPNHFRHVILTSLQDETGTSPIAAVLRQVL